MATTTKKKRRTTKPLGSLVRAGSKAEAGLDDLKVLALQVGFYAGAALLLGGGGYLAVQHVVRIIRERSSENDSSIDGRPAYWAGQLLAAFSPSGTSYDGTDEDLVFETLRAVPTKSMWAKVQTAYRNLTRGGSLDADLRNELTSWLGSDDYQTALQILNSKPA